MQNNASHNNSQDDSPRDHEGIAYQVRQSARARRISLRITPDGKVEIVVPERHILVEPDAFVSRYAGWIRGRLERVKRSGPTSLLLGSTLFLLGEVLAVHVIVAQGKRGRVVRTSAGLVVYVPDEKTTTRIRILKKWCVTLAREVVPARVYALNREHRFVFRKVSIRDQKTRWGSCSRSGTLSFNWRLVLLPSDVMTYLIYHELAHITHMNHSPRYWRFVEKLYPEYRAAERWLRKNSRSIVA